MTTTLRPAPNSRLRAKLVRPRPKFERPCLVGAPQPCWHPAPLLPATRSTLAINPREALPALPLRLILPGRMRKSSSSLIPEPLSGNFHEPCREKWLNYSHFASGRHARRPMHPQKPTQSCGFARILGCGLYLALPFCSVLSPDIPSPSPQHPRLHAPRGDPDHHARSLTRLAGKRDEQAALLVAIGRPGRGNSALRWW